MEEVLSTGKEMQGMEKIWGEQNIINSIDKDSEASKMTIRQLEIQIWCRAEKSKVYKRLGTLLVNRSGLESWQWVRWLRKEPGHKLDSRFISRLSD